jgi:hypothetical protein
MAIEDFEGLGTPPKRDPYLLFVCTPRKDWLEREGGWEYLSSYVIGTLQAKGCYSPWVNRLLVRPLLRPDNSAKYLWVEVIGRLKEDIDINERKEHSDGT